MRDQIWGNLVNLKYKGFVLNELVSKFQKRDRNINIYLALTSSGSIAAWAIWNQYPMLWGAIIAASQIISVIKPYFPFYKYVKELNAKNLRADNLSIEFEKLWYRIQENKITEDDAETNYFDLLKQMTELFNFSDDIIFKVSKPIEQKANEATRNFFKTNYNVIINLNQLN